jgi:hypothetical protein
MEQMEGPTGQLEIQITIEDDGKEMDDGGLHAFLTWETLKSQFLRTRATKGGESLIGEKRLPHDVSFW